jgi:hypothetical protein
MGVRRPEEPWVTVSADLLGPYPRSKKGNTYIVVFQDYFTKWVECHPLRVADAKSVVEAFHQLIVLRWGVHKFLLCDNGPQFVSNLLTRVAEAYGMQVRHTPPYTPQANPVERVNRVLKTMIACYLTDRHVDWDRYLSEFTFAMNTAEHSATGFSPAYLNYGRELTAPTALESVPVGEMKVQPTLHKAWAERLTQLSEVNTLVKSNLEEAYSRSRIHYNLRRRELRLYPGQLVLKKNFILSSSLHKVAGSLAPKFGGPFRVVKALSDQVYELETMAGKAMGKWYVKDLKVFVSDEL